MLSTARRSLEASAALRRRLCDIATADAARSLLVSKVDSSRITPGTPRRTQRKFGGLSSPAILRLATGQFSPPRGFRRGIASPSYQNRRGIHTTTGSISPDPNDRLLVVGSGVAGCSAALIAAERYNIPVTLLFAGSVPTDCNSYWAQGGIIYRNYDPASGDGPESLSADVHRAGAGLCLDEAVWKVAREGPDRVKELLLDDSPDGPFANVPFDRKECGALSLCLEASHSAPRIIHWADHTGKAITEHITHAAINHPLITPVAEAVVTDLAVEVHPTTGERICVGAHVLNRRTKARTTLPASRGTVLASGGLGGIYEHSTNPAGFNALGSSAALASRAGARTEDLEYVQFHPTSLFVPNEARFLLTEALRGEGAVLRDADGRAFARDYHPDGELAPRDVVARAVFAESQKMTPAASSSEQGEEEAHNTFLDISHRDSAWLKGRFPSIDAHLSQRGMDITRDPLPVIPAAHYTCGGISTDSHGRTSLTGLYAAGEAARTGLHGGNRLASTSLLEGLVYGAAVADFVGGAQDDAREAAELSRDILHSGRTLCDATLEGIPDGGTCVNGASARVVSSSARLLTQLKKVMWDDVGLVRTPRGLDRALSRLAEIGEEAEELYRKVPCAETSGLRDAAAAGTEVATAARANRVSRGAHTILLLDEEETSSSDSTSTISAAAASSSKVEEREDDSDDEEEMLGAGFGI